MATTQRALGQSAEGDTLRTYSPLLRRFLRHLPPDTIELKRQVAKRALELNRYPYS